MNLDLAFFQNALGGAIFFALGGGVLLVSGIYFGWLISLLHPEEK